MYLPLSFLEFSNSDFSVYTFSILGKHVNNGRLPHFIFNPQNISSVFAVLLEKMNAITVCSGVSDQELQTSLSDRNVGKESYFLEKGKDRKACTIKKCFRSSSCNYILPITSCTRCSKCQDLQRSFRGQRKLSSFESRTAHDSHAQFSRLSCTELTARARNIQKVLTASQRQSRNILHLYEQQKLIKAPKTFHISHSGLSKMVDIALDNKWLTEDSILYALLYDTLTSFKNYRKSNLQRVAN